jgi:hypothetical protein
MKLTEAFGPAGKGWGIDTYTVNVIDIPPTGEKMVCITVTIFYMDDKERCVTPPGFGQDFIIKEVRDGLKVDGESYKKAFTDALGNAAKYLGLGADVYMGMYDDSKYVNSMTEKFGEAKEIKPPKANEPATTPKPEPESGTLPPIPEGREHLAEIIDGKLAIKRQSEADGVQDSLAFLEWYMCEATDLQMLIKIGTGVSPDLGAGANDINPITAGTRTWTINKLSKVKKDTSLKSAWQKIAGVVNGLKNTSPLVYEGIVAGFRQKKKDLSDAQG